MDRFLLQLIGLVDDEDVHTRHLICEYADLKTLDTKLSGTGRCHPGESFDDVHLLKLI